MAHNMYKPFTDSEIADMMKLGPFALLARENFPTTLARWKATLDAERSAHEKTRRERDEAMDALVNKIGETWWADISAAQARIAELEAILSKFMVLPQRAMQREVGPWRHGYGCPAEDSTGNDACTCGAWGIADQLRSAYDEATVALSASSPKDALRAIVTRAVDAGFDEGTAWMTRSGELSSAPRRASIVSSILGPEVTR